MIAGRLLSVTAASAVLAVAQAGAAYAGLASAGYSPTVDEVSGRAPSVIALLAVLGGLLGIAIGGMRLYRRRRPAGVRRETTRPPGTTAIPNPEIRPIRHSSR